jgi:ribosomal-protein-serine acetyltransferase
MVPETLTTERFVLRRFARRDADSLHDAVAVSLPDLGRWMPWAHDRYGKEDAVAYIRDSGQSWKEGRAYDFAIRRPQQPDHHIGNVSIWTVSRLGRVAEIGYWIRSDETSAGAATEVTRRMIRVGFDDLLMHKINLRIAAGNRASERVAEKLGFSREGILREELFIRNKWVDHTLYSLLEREWRQVRNRV